MKIAICVHNLTGGGAERVAALWATGFYNEGYEVSMILTDRYAPRTYPVPAGVTIHPIDAPCNNRCVRWAWRKVLQVWCLRRLFRKIQPNVVIGVMLDIMPLIDKARKGMSMKVIATDHYSYERPIPIKKEHIYLRYHFNKRFDAVTVLTQADKNYIGNRLTNVFVLPNPLAFDPVKEIPSKKKIILAAGRLDAGYTKGFDFLIKAFGISCMDDWILQIAGGGNPESFEKYKQLAKECGVEDKVQFLGYVADPLPLYRVASIFVLSSRYEAFGMVLIEAMSQGCACIACDYKGRQSEIITNEKDGLLCAPDDVDSLAQAMRRVMIDEELRNTCQENAPIRAADFSVNDIEKKWETIFREIGL